MSSREGGFPVVLERLGYEPQNNVSICYKSLQGLLSATSTTADKAPEVADGRAGIADVYFGVNEVPPQQSLGGSHLS
jgi:hypothetical protein